MRVVIPMEERYCRTPDGSLWGQGPHTYTFWQRYLTVFDQVRIVARVRDVKQQPGNARRVDGPSVEYSPVPYYVGPLQFMQQARAVRNAVRAALGPKDAVIMRVSSTLATCLEGELAAKGRPYGLEVIGDPYDVFAPGAISHPLRPFFRWWFPRSLRRQCANAAGVAYVTEHTLQKRYPCGTYSVGMSDVVLHEDALVPQPPVFTTHYSSVELGEDATLSKARSIPERGASPLVRVATVGSLEQPYKGVDVLIRAVALARAAGLDIRLTVVGDGRYRASLEELARTLDIASVVNFAGQFESPQQVRLALDATDLFVLASRTEGLPRVMIEAMARALPCIGTTVGGIPELLEPENLVRPDDATALANKIIEVVSQPDRIRRMSSRNLEKACEFRATVLDARRKKFFEHIRTVTEKWLQ